MKRLYTINQKEPNGDKTYISIGTEELLKEYKEKIDSSIEFKEVKTFRDLRGDLEYIILPIELGVQSFDRFYFVQGMELNNTRGLNNIKLDSFKLVMKQNYLTDIFLKERVIYDASLQLLLDPESVIVEKEELISRLTKSVSFENDGKIVLSINTPKEYRLSDFKGMNIEQMIVAILNESIEIIEQQKSAQQAQQTEEANQAEEVKPEIVQAEEVEPEIVQTEEAEQVSEITE